MTTSSNQAPGMRVFLVRDQPSQASAVQDYDITLDDENYNQYGEQEEYAPMEDQDTYYGYEEDENL